MDALAHPLDAVRGTPPWHQHLVSALLRGSAGPGGSAADAQGNRVRVLQRPRLAGLCCDLLVQRFDRHGGERDASPILVARRLDARAQAQPTVGLGPEGHFVVAWQAVAADGRDAIRARRYAPCGAALGPAFEASTGSSAVPRVAPLVAVNAAGAFVVLWEHAWTRVHARLYASSGEALGGEIDVYPVAALRGAAQCGGSSATPASASPSSRDSQALADTQSRRTVRSVTPSASAISLSE